MKTVIAILVVLFAFLQYQLWFAPGGVTNILHLNKSIAQMHVVNNKLKEKNAILAADVESLKHGNQAIEERAREGLGMIKKGETFYQVVN